MNTTKKLVWCLLLSIFSNYSTGLVLDDNQNSTLNGGPNYNPIDASNDASNDTSINTSVKRNDVKAINFADSIFECGVYYQYTAGGLKNNPDVPSETIRRVSQNADSLLRTADQLYTSAGISTKEKYQEMMLKSKHLIQQRQDSRTGISDLIFEFGEKCRLLLVNYPSKLKEISDSLELN